MQTPSDTVEVADLLRTLKQQWRAILSFIALGVVGALLIVLFAPRQYDGKVSVLARSSSSGGSSLIGRMTGIGDLLGGVGGLGGVSGVETEVQVLKSRALAGQVVDSLLLQARVRSPAGVAPRSLFQAYSLISSFKPVQYEFTRRTDGLYDVSGSAKPVALGGTVALPIGSVTLQTGKMPDSFAIQFMDHEDAINRFARKVDVSKAGGEVLKVVYHAADSLSAADGANALVAFYLERRKTVDRGSNQRKVEYVTAQVDSAAAQLATAERELRRSQENSRVFDAEISDKSQLEAEAKLREQLNHLEVDERSLKQLLVQAEKGTLTSRDLAAYPAFMHGSAVSPLVTQLVDLETTKTGLLDRRTEKDPEIIAIDNSIKNINATIVGLARTYADATTKQRIEFQARLDSTMSSISALPAANERVGRLKRDVLRLTQLYTALQAQLVEARLGAISEGGDIKQIDVAVPPRAPAFPDPLLTMGIGVAGGLFAGIVAALFLGWFGRWLRDPAEIERAVGISAERFVADRPLLVAGAALQRTVLVVPLDERAHGRLVAERLARTATTRSLPVHMLDFSTNGRPVQGDLETNVSRSIEQLEQQDGMLIVQLPGLSSDATLAALRETRPVLLVAAAGPVDRSKLSNAVDTLRRMNVPCAGIIIGDGRTSSNGTSAIKHVFAT